MQQLRLFPRAGRLPVVVLDDGAGGAATLLRRLRRSRRLDPVAADPARLGGGHAAAAADAPAAVLVCTAEHPAAVAELHRQVVTAGATPVVAVVAGGRDATLSALQAGAEEVVRADRATGPELERAVLAAVTRRVADLRDGRGGAADALTGLATRARLDAELPGLLVAAAGGGHQVAVCYCDLDRLKQVNDALGHGIGDAVLVEAAARLRAAVRSGDLVVRVGGDEFVIVLRGPHVEAVADEVARRVVEAFVRPVEVEDHRLAVGVSVGLAVARDGDTAASLVDRADRALYLAKRRGRGRVATAEPRAAAEGAERHADRLREALVRDRLVLEHHPVVAASGEALLGHRSVVGWSDPGGAATSSARTGPVPPPAAVAEDCGLTPSLFGWTVRSLAGSAPPSTLAAGPLRRYLDLPRAVLAGSPARRLEPLLAAGALGGADLVVLVDERHLLDADAVRAPLLDLARAGVRVGVARFGAVHGALAVLERHPVESVWLDLDAVEGLATCAVRRARLRAVLEVTGALGQHVVAPVPRRPEDAAVLAELGPVALERTALDLRSGERRPASVEAPSLRR